MPRKKKVEKEEEVKKEIDYSSYPVTPIVAAWQNMVTEAMNRYEAQLTEPYSEEQKKRLSIFQKRIDMAPYVLRNYKNVRKSSK